MSYLLPENDCFSQFQISERLAAETSRKSGRRDLTTQEMSQIECSSEWRGLYVPKAKRGIADCPSEAVSLGEDWHD